LLWGALLYPQPGHPATLRVPSQFATIQVALDASGSGDTVSLAPGLYTGTGNHSIDFRGKGIVIRSAAGVGEAVIDAQASKDIRRRVFWFHSGEDSTARLEGLVIRGGWAPSDGSFGESRGGGILCDSASYPRVTDCIITGNRSATGGGGIATLRYSRPVFIRCAIVSNECLYSSPAPTGGWGGGVGCVSESAPAFYDCRIADNIGNLGGGVSALHGHLTLDSCVLQNNRAEAFVSLQPPAGGQGGAVLLDQGSARIRATIISGNAAMASGTEPARGGALASFFSYFEMDNCTLTRNVAQSNGSVSSLGAGLYCSFSAPVIRQSILAYNLDAEAVFCIDAFSRPQLVCCDVYGNETGDWSNCISGQGGAASNFSADPLFCDQYPGDLVLKSQSPCAPAQSLCGERVGALDVACIATATDEEADLTILPERLDLLPCAPNPFNAATMISFSLARPANVEIAIYDVLGRLVAIPLVAYRSAGTHELRWTARDSRGRSLGSGVYFIVARADGQLDRTQALLLK
jgi:hypothetical protein